MPNQAAVFWRFVLCDLLGRPISLLSSVASQKQLSYPLNRPARLSFTVPSDHQIVNEIYDVDGWNEPALTVGCRTIKGWRRTSGQEGSWTLRYNGIVWNLQDSGDGTSTRTSVDVYDPMQILRKRMVRSADGVFRKPVILSEQDGDVIAKAFVDRTIAYAGECGITTDTAEGASFTTAPEQSGTWNQKDVASAMIQLCDTGLLDVWFQPLDIDAVARPTHPLAAMHAGPRRGSDKPNVVIAYAAPGRTAYRLDRTLSMEEVANSIYLYGGTAKGHLSHAEDADSISKFYAYEDAQVITDIHTPTLLDDLVTEQIVMRKDARDLLTVLPTPGLAAAPFTQYFVGDTVQVLAGLGGDQAAPRGSSTRGALQGLSRIYGLSIDVDDDGVERVAGLDVSPQGLGA